MSTTMLDQDRRRVPNDFAEHIMDDNRVESQNDLVCIPDNVLIELC